MTLAHEARFLGEPCDHACRYYDRMRFERVRKQQRERADWLAAHPIPGDPDD